MAWFFVIGTTLNTLLNFETSVFNFYFGLIVFFISISTIIGSGFLKKQNKRKYLFVWILSGIFATASLMISGTFFQTLSLLLVGISWGLGLPYCLSLLANWTDAAERGRVSGAIILLTFSIVAVALLTVRFLYLDFFGIILLGIALRSISLIALFLDPFESHELKEAEKEKVRSILHYRNFLLYLVPWLIFNAAIGLVNFVWIGLQTSDYAIIGENGNLVRFVSFAVFGLVSGVIADHYGRKPPIILGLVMLGISFTFLGLATLSFTSLVSSAVIVYYVTSGVAWGFLTPVYLAILGDLPFFKKREAVYTLGLILPLFVFVGSSLMPYLMGISVPANFLSIVLSIMLFSSVVPILYASETLPEYNLQKMRMKNYLDKVEKIIDESKG